MPEKMKLKCASCGTWFKASGYKRTLCASCFAKAARARTVAKSQPLPAMATPAARAPASATSAGSPAAAPPLAPAPRALDGSPRTAPDAAARAPDSVSTRARFPSAPGVTPPPRPPKASRDPLVPTLDQIAAIERRYTELAQPSEFDGIRSKIAEELRMPRAVVKRVVKDYRERLHLPSWWDVSHQPLTAAQIELVRDRYVPLLPLPPIGVHHRLAAELGFNGWAVYQAIGQIRQQLGLARYNEREDAPHPETPPDGERPRSSEAPASVVA